MSSLNHTALLMRLTLRSMSSNDSEFIMGCGAFSCWLREWSPLRLDVSPLNEGRSLCWLNDGSSCWLKAGKSLLIGLAEVVLNDGKSFCFGLSDSLLSAGRVLESARGLKDNIETVGLTSGDAGVVWTGTRGGRGSRWLFENDTLSSDAGGLGDASDYNNSAQHSISAV